MSNITEIVNAEKSMTTLKKIVHAACLDEFLCSDGPYTLFAPCDLAFRKMDKGVLENLLRPESITKLKNLVNTHIASGSINYADLKDGDELYTVNGGKLLVHIKDGKVNIQGANIQDKDIQASNGVMHFLDTVLID